MIQELIPRAFREAFLCSFCFPSNEPKVDIFGMSSSMGLKNPK